MKKQIPLFLIIGSIGFFIDDGGVYLVVSHFEANPFWGRIPGFILAICTTFLLNYKFTFVSETPPPIFAAFLKYIAANAIAQSTNYFLYALLIWQISLFTTFPVLAVALGSIIAAVMSFILYKKVVFKNVQ